MIQKLPEELLTKIIDSIDSCHDIGQCRAVCKQWSRLAEPLMFSKQIVLNDDEEALSFYGHLLKNPENGKLIKYLKFGCSYYTNSVLEALLPLVFTPNMEYMIGDMGTDQIYMILAKVVGTTPERFTRLKSIPHPEFYSALYDSLLYAFKDTLEDVVCILDDENGNKMRWSITEHLGTFRSLKRATLDGTVSSLFELENVLKDCSGLEGIILDILLQDSLHLKSEIEAWSSINVKIIESVKKVTITHQSRSDLLEYIIFKYPSIDTIEVDTRSSITVKRNNLQRMLNAMKKVRSLKASFGVEETNLPNTIKYLIADGTRFTLEENDIQRNYTVVINST